MHRKFVLALFGAVLALAAAPAATTLAAGGTTVTVRVEGLKHTLLVPTVVHTHSGSITKGGAPPGACSATSGAGALDVATHHKWNGMYSANIGGLFITKILGDFESGTKYFWSIFLNNASGAGACAITLHHGDQLLFAVIPATGGTVYPLALKAPDHAKLGAAFTVKVVWFDAKGKPKPLAGAHVQIGAVSTVSNSQGVVHVDPTRKGTLVVRADKTGYIRAASLRVRVSS